MAIDDDGWIFLKDDEKEGGLSEGAGYNKLAILRSAALDMISDQAGKGLEEEA